MSANVVTLVMPAKSEYLILARLALAGIARETPIDESVLADLKLAVTEACGNAVRHAYGDDPGVVRVRFVVGRTRSRSRSQDDGTTTPVLRPRVRAADDMTRSRAAWASPSSVRSSTSSTSTRDGGHGHRRQDAKDPLARSGGYPRLRRSGAREQRRASRGRRAPDRGR